MANALYNKGREGFLDGSIQWLAHTIVLSLIDENDDTIDLAVDDNIDDRLVGSRVATSDGLTSKTATDGVADSADKTLTAVTGDVAESIDVWKSTGTESSSRLICNIDTATGLPVTPNGGDINVQWDNGGNKIFML